MQTSKRFLENSATENPPSQGGFFSF